MSNKSRTRSKANPGWFPKGRSGNLKGRPRGSRAPESSAFEVLIERTLTVTDRGGTREITMEEALQRRTYQDALKGKRMAIREIMKWIRERDAWLAEHAPKPPRQEITIRAAPDPDNADAALLLLGVAAPDQDRAGFSGRELLLLEPWVVKAALRRRRGGQRLTDRQLEEIRRCTRDPDSPRWETDE